MAKKQIEYVLKNKYVTKKELLKLDHKEEDLRYEKIYISKYDTYLHFKPFRYLAIFIMILFFILALFVFSLSFIYEEITNTIVLILFLITFGIIFFNVLIGLLLKHSFYGINNQLEKDNLINTKGIIKKIYVVNYTQFF